MLERITETLEYWLSEQPLIVGFRWSDNQSWGSTWSFLVISISFYLLLSLFLNSVLLLFQRRKPIPLGPIPAIHSLAMALISVGIFVGTLLSALAEIRETSWFWRRSKTPLQWLLCFPLGTRPAGRVFFWSYIFYLSRYLHLLRTFFSIIRRRKLTFFRLIRRPILICMSFLWLEYSQSFQVVAILAATLVYSIVYGYRFWVAIGLPRSYFPIIVNCQVLLLGCNLVCHVGVLLLHFRKGGCNGIGAWVINSVLNGALLLLFLNNYVKMHLKNGKVIDDFSSHSHSTAEKNKEL